MQGRTLGIRMGLATALIICPMGTGSAAGVGQLTAPASAGANDAGAQLKRTREQQEQEQRLQRLKEQPEKAKVEGEAGKHPGEKESGIRFLLKKVEFSKSEILSAQELDAVAKAYVGKEVSLQDIQEMIKQINAIYHEKGYLTCYAYLGPQTIHEGVVHVDIIEGKTGKVELKGNRSTNASYLYDRVSLHPGTVADINQLNRDLLRFNATNDAQLHITMKAGQAYGTTDYVLTVLEPQEQVTGSFSDNGGNDTSGLYRGGIFWQDKSLTGNRDALFLSGQWSKGTKAFSLDYRYPISRNGLKLGLDYSANSVHIIKGALEPLGPRGRAYAQSVSLTQPLVSTERQKTEIGWDYGRQHSRTDLSHLKWVDDTVRGGSMFYDQMDYGHTSAIYQRHSYRAGNWSNVSSAKRTFGHYNMNLYWQKRYAAGQTISVRTDMQLSSTQYLPGSEEFYIGGMYSVRGYKESLLGGDSGISGSLEYSMPLASRDWSAYMFWDRGCVWGRSAFDDNDLDSVGCGIKASLGNHMSLNLNVGFPLLKEINGAIQSKARVHFSCTSQF